MADAIVVAAAVVIVAAMPAVIVTAEQIAELIVERAMPARTPSARGSLRAAHVLRQWAKTKQFRLNPPHRLSL